MFGFDQDTNTLTLDESDFHTDKRGSTGFEFARKVLLALNTRPADRPFFDLPEFAELVSSFLNGCADRAIMITPEIVEIAIGYGLNVDLVDRHVRRELSLRGVVFETITEGAPHTSTCEVTFVLLGLDHDAAFDVLMSVLRRVSNKLPPAEAAEMLASADGLKPTAVDDDLLELPPRFLAMQVESAFYAARVQHVATMSETGDVRDRPFFNFLLDERYGLSTSVLIADNESIDEFLGNQQWEDAVNQMTEARPDVLMDIFTNDDDEVVDNDSDSDEEQVAYYVITGEMMSLVRVARILTLRSEYVAIEAFEASHPNFSTDYFGDHSDLSGLPTASSALH